MRNAVQLEGGLILTTDNSGGIGMKAADVVSVPDRTTARFAARVALLEQWAAGAEPIAVLIHNFSGPESWPAYEAGVQDVFEEAGMATPTITGSTETNMELLQSALGVTMVGKLVRAASEEELVWFTYGVPLVGNAVLEQEQNIASLGKIWEALHTGLIKRVWPVGSGGLLKEVRDLYGIGDVTIQSPLDTAASAGPSTCVLVAVPIGGVDEAKLHFGEFLHGLAVIR
ncbi:alpha-ribazole-5-phosphate synthase [Sporosarcina sp. Te-1]|uniref:alpha-ribazole-5-phosphate synthase n=1 Tax=Sporosarcina sp. Te-1 TaxID=2818390 RepID=UPI001A9E726A|nr:alpha-ribazole-5-phosphate synthase [Sporosarcina sp. Te-1]QTD40730.1 alpha-ribazole-5-phosphate synthase [Sporosarcina sp. Te-1]